MNSTQTYPTVGTISSANKLPEVSYGLLLLTATLDKENGMRFFELSSAVTTILCILTGCSQFAKAPELVETERLSAPRLPNGYIRTDGRGAIAVTIAGEVGCGRLGASEVEQALVSTNNVRARRGLAALSTDSRLQRAAEEHACDMARRGVMTHVGTKTAGPGMRVKALGYRPAVTSENIAAGRMDLPKTLHEWTSSPNHQSNMIIPGLRHMGIGHAIGSDGKTAFWAAIYAQPR